MLPLADCCASLEARLPDGGQGGAQLAWKHLLLAGMLHNAVTGCSPPSTSRQETAAAYGQQLWAGNRMRAAINFADAHCLLLQRTLSCHNPAALHAAHVSTVSRQLLLVLECRFRSGYSNPPPALTTRLALSASLVVRWWPKALRAAAERELGQATQLSSSPALQATSTCRPNLLHMVGVCVVHPKACVFAAGHKMLFLRGGAHAAEPLQAAEAASATINLQDLILHGSPHIDAVRSTLCSPATLTATLGNLSAVYARFTSVPGERISPVAALLCIAWHAQHAAYPFSAGGVDDIRGSAALRPQHGSSTGTPCVKATFPTSPAPAFLCPCQQQQPMVRCSRAC